MYARVCVFVHACVYVCVYASRITLDSAIERVISWEEIRVMLLLLNVDAIICIKNPCNCIANCKFFSYKRNFNLGKNNIGYL